MNGRKMRESKDEGAHFPLAIGAYHGVGLPDLLDENAPLAYDEVRHGYMLTDETFALSRFREIEPTGEHFHRAPDFDAKAYAREAFGITRGEKVLRVRLLFEPKLAVYIMEREWHPLQKFTQLPDGQVEMQMETTGRQELIRWVLSWMPHVRVLVSAL